MTTNCCFSRLVGGATILLALGAQPSPAQETAPEATPEPRQNPVLVELFLSQACSMCPQAAALFPEIAARGDVVALAWHVDYWNMTSTSNGRWEDPYSHAAFTKRQKRYNMNIRNKGSIYTPQVIVGGDRETVGGKKDKISALINEAPHTDAAISTSLSDATMMFTIEESETGGNAYLVTFKKRTSTRITAGLNAGKVFEEAHVVTQIHPLGIVRKRGGEIIIDKPANDDDCALIVQEPGQKRIIAATYCPA